MTRQEELNEFLSLLQALIKKYEVRLDVSINDARPAEINTVMDTAVEGEVLPKDA